MTLSWPLVSHSCFGWININAPSLDVFYIDPATQCTITLLLSSMPRNLVEINHLWAKKEFWHSTQCLVWAVPSVQGHPEPLLVNGRRSIWQIGEDGIGGSHFCFGDQPIGVGDASWEMHRLHDVLQFFETSLKNRIVENWKVVSISKKCNVFSDVWGFRMGPYSF